MTQGIIEPCPELVCIFEQPCRGINLLENYETGGEIFQQLCNLVSKMNPEEISSYLEILHYAKRHLCLSKQK